MCDSNEEMIAKRLHEIMTEAQHCQERLRLLTDEHEQILRDTDGSIFYYLGFIGSVVDPEGLDGPAHGKVLGVPDLITYEAPHEPEDLEHYFQQAVGEYIDTLLELDRPVIGSFGYPSFAFQK